MNAVMLPAEIPDAPLPVRYEAARKALAECEAIDEVKDFSDKAAALAVYARQANDTSLHMMALRIKARAERRAGELLKQIPAGDIATRFQARAVESRPPGDDPNNGRASPARPVTRTQAARDAGFTPYQQKTAMRVANVPAESFERQVESERPPSVAALAAQGAVRAAAPDPAAEQAREAKSALATFAKLCARIDAGEAAGAVTTAEAMTFRQHVRAIDTWLDAFVTRLPDQSF
jgi:hypothetical protein